MPERGIEEKSARFGCASAPHRCWYCSRLFSSTGPLSTHARAHSFRYRSLPSAADLFSEAVLRARDGAALLRSVVSADAAGYIRNAAASPRWIAVVGLAVAMSILAGFTAATMVVGIAAGLGILALLAGRQSTWRIVPAAAAGFVLGALISTVELVPLWHLAQVSIASARGTWYVNGRWAAARKPGLARDSGLLSHLRAGHRVPAALQLHISVCLLRRGHAAAARDRGALGEGARTAVSGRGDRLRVLDAGRTHSGLPFHLPAPAGVPAWHSVCGIRADRILFFRGTYGGAGAGPVREAHSGSGAVCFVYELRTDTHGGQSSDELRGGQLQAGKPGKSDRLPDGDARLSSANGEPGVAAYTRGLPG